MRIISLLPSATEMLCELGLSSQIVGVSHECDFPTEVMKLPRVTASRIAQDASSGEIDDLVRQASMGGVSLFALAGSLIRRLAPDVIVSQSLCDVCAISDTELDVVLSTLDVKPTVIRVAPMSLEDVMADMSNLGVVLDCQPAASKAVNQLRARIERVQIRAKRLVYRPSVVMLEWLEPPYCAGHWNPELIDIAGGREMLGTSGSKSRRVDWTEVKSIDPEILLIACCGYDVSKSEADFRRYMTQPDLLGLRAIRNGNVYIGDGAAYFNRSGPRLVDTLELVAHALDPQVHPLVSTLMPLRRIAC